MRKILLFTMTALTLTLLTVRAASALGTEEFGNKPLAEANYTEWKEIVPLINDTTRVFQQWINGSEYFFYTGTSEDLNQALVRFASIEAPKHVVVLRPAPGKAMTFGGKEVPCKWSLHVVGGIAKIKTAEDPKDIDWLKEPVLTVYIGDGIDLEKIELPADVTAVAHPSDDASTAAQKKIAAYLAAKKAAK